MNDIIAIIPARGGSKGVFRKNIKLLAGYPLIYYTINAAKDVKLIDRVFVTTEDNEIAQISSNYGAEIISRPESLATDTTVTIPVLIHAIDYLKQKSIFPKIIILLQPTSPLRSSQDIINTIKIFTENDCKSVISVCEFDPSPYWSFRIKQNYLEPVFPEKIHSPRRQNLDKLYRPNGAIYISTPEYIVEFQSFFTDKTLPYLMSFASSTDIDHEMDFKIAEILLELQKNRE